MATRKKTTETPAQVVAQTLTLVGDVTSTTSAGKAAVDAAKRSSFDQNVDALVKLGEHLTTKVAPFIAGTFTATNIVAAFKAKDHALYVSDSDDRAKLASETHFVRALRAYRFDSADTRDLFVNGPKGEMHARCKALQGVTGHSPSVQSYHDFLGAMNSAEIAQVKAIPAATLAKWTIYRDDQTSAVVYAKSKGVVAGDQVKVKRNAITEFASGERDAVKAYVDAAPFDLSIDPAKLEDFAKYVVGLWTLAQGKQTETETETAPPVTKVTV